MKNKLRKALSREIAIEYKACLYFSCIVFFEWAYLLYRKLDAIPMAFIWEIILTAYAIGYLQVYLLDNFDEAERFGIKEMARTLICAGIYTGMSLLFGWYGRNFAATVLFFGYICLCYGCVFLCNKIKRTIDTEKLNEMLEAYKKGGAV